MKAVIQLELGCDAGSEYCGRCDSVFQDMACKMFFAPLERQPIEAIAESFKLYPVRCKQCKDAEKEAKK